MTQQSDQTFLAKYDNVLHVLDYKLIDHEDNKVKVKAGGGNAGHNGLRSISAHLENDYKRVRLGIGHPGAKDAVVHYVLNDFAKSERGWLSDLLDAVSDAAPYLAKGDDSRFLSDVAKILSLIVSQPSPSAMGELIVDPGKPETSWLMQKMDGDVDCGAVTCKRARACAVCSYSPSRTWAKNCCTAPR